MQRFFCSLVAVLFLMITPLLSWAGDVERISFSGSTLLYPLPEGFCNVTDDLQGLLLKDLLDKQQDPMLPTAQIILAPCNQSPTNAGYPWGWVGLIKDANAVSQQQMNKIVAKLLQNEDLLNKLESKIGDGASKALDEVFGVEATLDSMAQRIVWADEDSNLLISTAVSKLDGVTIKEKIATSTTVVNDLYVYTYLYNLDGAEPSAKEMSYTLINNAPKLKTLN